MKLPPLSEGPGPYYWAYVDVQAGRFAAVAIFMIGSPFSTRYAARRHQVPARAHSAVNFALYEGDRRIAWALTEYDDARCDGRSLRIGRSEFVRHADGRVQLRIDEREAPRGGPVKAELELWPEAPSLPEQELLPGAGHYWRPIAVRAAATLQVTSHRVSLSGRGYHDENRGNVPLGTGVSRWTWARVHRSETTEVLYHLGDPTSDLRVHASRNSIDVARGALSFDGHRRTGWGLRVPARGSALLESSPFYARMAFGGDREEGVLEVADFARFQSPFIRWMARYRSRIGSAVEAA